MEVQMYFFRQNSLQNLDQTMDSPDKERKLHLQVYKENSQFNVN